MNKNSLAAYFDETNKRKFNSHEAQIVRLLTYYNTPKNRFQVSFMLGISDHAAQKRLSDLLRKGIITVSGEQKHGNNTVSLYSLNKYPPEQKKPAKSLKSFLKEKHPEIWEEYEQNCGVFM